MLESDREVNEQIGAELRQIVDALPRRIDIDPDLVSRDLAALVLTLVELIRRVVEHQAIQRMDDPDLSEEQVERMGLALLGLEEKMAEIRDVFGLAAEDLNIDLGPLGRLL
jgi:actin-like ATPase involved in cell morphogenesis